MSMRFRAAMMIGALALMPLAVKANTDCVPTPAQADQLHDGLAYSDVVRLVGCSGNRLMHMANMDIYNWQNGQPIDGQATLRSLTAS